MSILVNKKTPVLVQGITGEEGRYWTGHMLGLGTRVVAGVTPGKQGQEVEGVPVYNTVREAVYETGAEASVVFVPPKFTKDAVFEALDSSLKTVVTIAEGIPVHDALEIRAGARALGATVIGGNTSGVITPGEGMLGIFPYWLQRVYHPGDVGVMTRSGSLTNEITAKLVKGGFGVSTLVGIGGDQIPASRFVEIAKIFEQDPQTSAMLIIGELGGTMEEEVAEAINEGCLTKPVGAFIAGRTAPTGKTMGHAGAIASLGGKGSAAHKVEALREAGARVADRPSEVSTLFQNLNAYSFAEKV